MRNMARTMPDTDGDVCIKTIEKILEHRQQASIFNVVIEVSALLLLGSCSCQIGSLSRLGR